jgi:hypothetical protein
MLPVAGAGSAPSAPPGSGAAPAAPAAPAADAADADAAPTAGLAVARALLEPDRKNLHLVSRRLRAMVEGVLESIRVGQFNVIGFRPALGGRAARVRAAAPPRALTATRWPGLLRLEVLFARAVTPADVAALCAAPHARLASLRLNGRLNAPAAAALARAAVAALPRLRRLALAPPRVGVGKEACACGVTALGALFSAAWAPPLAELEALPYGRQRSWGVLHPRLAAAPLAAAWHAAPGLTALRLGGGLHQLGPLAARALAQAGWALELLALDGNPLRDEGLEALAAAAAAFPSACAS